MAFFRQRAALQVEILALRHQLGFLQRSVKRPKLTAAGKAGSVRDLFLAGISKAEIARRLKIGRTSVRRLLEQKNS